VLRVSASIFIVSFNFHHSLAVWKICHVSVELSIKWQVMRSAVRSVDKVMNAQCGSLTRLTLSYQLFTRRKWVELFWGKGPETCGARRKFTETESFTGNGLNARSSVCLYSRNQKLLRLLLRVLRLENGSWNLISTVVSIVNLHPFALSFPCEKSSLEN